MKVEVKVEVSQTFEVPEYAKYTLISGSYVHFKEDGKVDKVYNDGFLFGLPFSTIKDDLKHYAPCTKEEFEEHLKETIANVKALYGIE